MSYFELKSFPTFAFAHKFSAEQYHGHHDAGTNRIEISAITEGELSIDYDGKIFHLKEGDVLCNFFRKSSEIHAPHYHSHHTACFWVDFKESNKNLLPLIVKDERSVCRHLIDEIIKTNLITPENVLKLSGLFFQLLGELDNMAEDKKAFTSGEYHYIKKTKKYIYEHISDPISQKEIAKFLGITPEYLCALFKKNEGRTVIRFINEIKLAHVRTMLINTNVTLAQAALQYGFSDPNYVSKLYKKYYNETITHAAKFPPPIQKEDE